MTRWARRWLVLSCWPPLALAWTAHVAIDERRTLAAALETESVVLHRVVSQRADQHDAHLTALSTLALAETPGPGPLFEELAAAIRRFYPRVLAIDLVPLHAGSGAVLSSRAPGETVASTAVPHAPVLRALGASLEAARALRPPSLPEGRYLLVKRVPGDPALPARFALALEIDARRLLATDAAFWRRPDTAAALALPDGEPLLAPVAPVATSRDASGPSRPLGEEMVLGSRTQPLRLATRLRPRAFDLLPAGRIAAGLGALALCVAAAWLAAGLLARARAAELRARVGEQEARLAQAGRINALGEMASGIAHELTQPLTAVLSQSQAGLRMLAARTRDDSDAGVREVLEANVLQARRAARILARLRTWTRPSSDRCEPVDVDGCVANVALLLGAEARRAGIELRVEPGAGAPRIVGDPVALEQVVFNLARNAMDAMAGQVDDRRIRLHTAVRGDRVEIEVADSGPGIDPAMAGRLFEPFASGKADGMGLGLALCERLVERMDGAIEVRDAPGGGVVARLEFPRSERRAPVSASTDR